MTARRDFRPHLLNHFVAFALLSLFAIAQLSWWVIFQVREGSRVTRIQQDLWSQQIALADERIAAGADARWLERTFPDLEITSSGTVSVRADALKRLDRTAGERMRMFLSEGIVFILLVLLGVSYIYWMLRRELIIERRQTTFLSATSHELKTPITSLRLYLDTLIERDLPAPKRLEMLAVMRKDLNRLTEQIERLLQAQALLSGRRQVQLQPTDLTEETQHVLDEVYARFDLKGFQLRSRLDPDLVAMAHPQRWHILVSNLLENAFKYSPQGGVVDFRLVRSDRHARLVISDEGIGFAPSEGERIFERFYRVGSEDTRSTSGTGLGLFLVREIASSMGGKVTATSPGEGKGATFTVTVPLAEESAHG